MDTAEWDGTQFIPSGSACLPEFGISTPLRWPTRSIVSIGQVNHVHHHVELVTLEQNLIPPRNALQ